MTWAAVLAAVVSIVAAGMSYRSERRAAREARGITTLNHKIAAIDKEAEQMRDDYRALMKAFGDTTGTMLSRFASVYAAGEVLRAHPQTNESLSKGIEQLAIIFAGATDGGKGGNQDVGNDIIASIRKGNGRPRANAIRTALVASVKGG